MRKREVNMDSGDPEIERIDTEENGTSAENDTALNFRALFSWNAKSDIELSLTAGDYITLYDLEERNGYFYGYKTGTEEFGYFPPETVCLNEDFGTEEDWENEDYFEEYGKLKLHKEMVNDVPRTTGYQRAIKGAKIEDKLVLDVGCGTGVLSIFSAMNKAKKVYAVDGSHAANHAHALVNANGYQEIIEVIQTEVSQLELPEKVDVLVSEWMGTFLVFEGMLETVLKARDKYLKPNGIMLPSTCQLFLCPVNAQEMFNNEIHFWDKQYGINFSCLKSEAIHELCDRPFCNYQLNSDDIIGDHFFKICDWDLKKIRVEELEIIENNFLFIVKREGQFSGMCSWFDVGFNGFEGENISTLSTGPEAPLTHWKQDLLLFKSPIQVLFDDEIQGTILIQRNPIWRRHYIITIDCGIFRSGQVNSARETIATINQRWLMWK